MSEAVAQANRGRVRPKLKLGVIAAVAALALALPSIASATNNLQIKTIEGAPNSNWCLDDTNWGLSPGTPLQLWQCLNPMSAHPNQQWYLTKINNAWCPNATPWDIPPQGICNVDLIHSVWAAQHGKDLCVDDWNDSYAQSPAVLWPCNSSDPAQQMLFQQGSYQAGLVGQFNGYAIYHNTGQNCLDNTYDRLVNGSRIQFYACNGTNAQGWWLHQ